MLIKLPDDVDVLGAPCFNPDNEGLTIILIRNQSYNKVKPVRITGKKVT